MSNPIVSLDEQAVRDELRELVRKTIEETINAMLDEEADQLVGAAPYERTDERAAYRAGHYERGFTATSGQVTLKMPKLEGMRFATAVVERYKRRETSVEEAIIEMHPAGVSTRRIEDVSEILWGAGVSAGTVSNLNGKAFRSVDEWRCRPLTRAYPRLYVRLHRRHLPEAQLGRLLRERGGDGDNRRERGRLPRGRRLRRGLHGVQGVLAGLPVVAEVARAARRAHVHRRQGRRHGGLNRRGVPRARGKYQRCTVHFYRNALAKAPKSKRSQVAAMLKAIHAMESREAASAKAGSVAAELESMRLKEAAKVVREGFSETLAYCEMPREHWRRIRTNNAIERLNREIRRRTRVVGTFPDGKSALMLVAARLKYVADSEWGSRRYLDASLLKE